MSAYTLPAELPHTKDSRANQRIADLKCMGSVVGFVALACAIAVIVVVSVGSGADQPVTTHQVVKSYAATADTGLNLFSKFGNNPCKDKKPTIAAFKNKKCVEDAFEQAGANVTKGYQGHLDVNATHPTSMYYDRKPITDPYYKKGLCPVNVHWHLGAEHLSVGEYDETGTGPSSIAGRRLAAGKVREGHQCKKYNAKDPKFTKPYKWQHCIGMEVGQTYEVHWPHSAVGDCGTPWQYQTPFYDGVFCHLPQTTEAYTTTPFWKAVGVQSQVFVIVNDEGYYYPDLMRGMIVSGDFGKDVAKYTGSTTGTSRNNIDCSSYTPITWQVDRKCHLISASTFDKMCADMKAQSDDMSDDLYAHGSREVVNHTYAANNQH